MTPQEAIEIITNAVQGDGTKVTAEQDKALAIVQRATQKQIPKRLTKNSGFGVCPNCNVIVAMREQSHGLRVIHHCKWCGQALDWGGEK